MQWKWCVTRHKNLNETNFVIFFGTKFSLTLIQRLFGTKFFQYQMVSDIILEMERDQNPNQHQNSDEKLWWWYMRKRYKGWYCLWRLSGKISRPRPIISVIFFGHKVFPRPILRLFWDLIFPCWFQYHEKLKSPKQEVPWPGRHSLIEKAQKNSDKLN